MMCRHRSYRVGDLVRIKNCVSHVIPAELAEGQQVRVVARDTGCTTVEDAAGKVWEVQMVLIDSEWSICTRMGSGNESIQKEM